MIVFTKTSGKRVRFLTGLAGDVQVAAGRARARGCTAALTHFTDQTRCLRRRRRRSRWRRAHAVEEVARADLKTTTATCSGGNIYIYVIPLGFKLGGRPVLSADLKIFKLTLAGVGTGGGRQVAKG